MTYIHGEGTWESFINKLDVKRSNLPLDATKVFTFILSLDLDYKIFSSLYAPSHCSYFLASLVFFTFFCVFSVPYNTRLQPLFIEFYNTTPIWTMRWSWPLDTWRILINPIRSWFPSSRRILNPLIFRWTKVVFC